MKAKQFFVTTLAVILTGMFTAANCKGPSAKSDYETVDGDPLKTRIYTLDNGLKNGTIFFNRMGRKALITSYGNNFHFKKVSALVMSEAWSMSITFEKA